MFFRKAHTPSHYSHIPGSTRGHMLVLPFQSNEPLFAKYPTKGGRAVLGECPVQKERIQTTPNVLNRLSKLKVEACFSWASERGQES